MIYLLIAVVMVGFVAAYLFYTSRCRALSELKDLKSKMTGYRVTLIIRLAILEALSLMALVLFIITGDLVHIAVAGFVIIYSLKLRPVKSTIARDLNLSSTEQAKLEDPNEIVAEFESQS
jgi:flagellar basal body-associated protein FliL